MAGYVALLRGINVGKAQRLAMADLRALVEDLGFTSVRTVLNSGNVVFTGPEEPTAGIAARIRESLAAHLSLDVTVVVLTAAELRLSAEKNPLLPAKDPSRMLGAFFTGPDDAARLRPLLGRDWAPEALAVGRHAAYLWCPDGIAGSPLTLAVGDALADKVTMRNWGTVERLLKMTSESEG